MLSAHCARKLVNWPLQCVILPFQKVDSFLQSFDLTSSRSLECLLVLTFQSIDFVLKSSDLTFGRLLECFLFFLGMLHGRFHFFVLSFQGLDSTQRLLQHRLDVDVGRRRCMCWHQTLIPLAFPCMLSAHCARLHTMDYLSSSRCRIFWPPLVIRTQYNALWPHRVKISAAQWRWGDIMVPRERRNFGSSLVVALLGSKLSWISDNVKDTRD